MSSHDAYYLTESFQLFHKWFLDGCEAYNMDNCDKAWYWVLGEGGRANYMRSVVSSIICRSLPVSISIFKLIIVSICLVILIVCHRQRTLKLGIVALGIVLYGHHTDSKVGIIKSGIYYPEVLTYLFERCCHMESCVNLLTSICFTQRVQDHLHLIVFHGAAMLTMSSSSSAGCQDPSQGKVSRQSNVFCG
jgi:hypothetical protein